MRGSSNLASPVATGEVASNASRWGRLWLAYTSNAMEGLQLASMAPPPPLTRSPSPALAGEARGTLRPLAGFWFLNFTTSNYAIIRDALFPSPCGVLVLKFDTHAARQELSAEFPSPCGVLVLKCQSSGTYRRRARRRFRSLAGFWFLNERNEVGGHAQAGVSVPLRGSLYLSFPRRYGGSGEQCEPIGALVPCVHF